MTITKKILVGALAVLLAWASPAMAQVTTDFNAVAAALLAEGTRLRLTAPGPIGGTTPSTGAFTTLSASGVFNASTGTAAAPSIRFANSETTGLYSYSTGNIGLTSMGTLFVLFNQPNIKIGSTGGFHWAQTANPADTPDVILARDAANTLALKNSTTRQEYRVYGSTTGPTYVSIQGTVAFASLGTPIAGSMTYCSDCTPGAAGVMATCTGGGTGAWAFRVNSTPTWGCIGI